MKLPQKQSFWITLATLALGSFTTFNTYQLQRFNELATTTQAQIVILDTNLNNLNGRIDNLYEIIMSLKENQNTGGYHHYSKGD